MSLEKHPKARALIFDLDGTLSDSLPVHLSIWHKVCAHFNCYFDEGMVEKMTGMPTIRFAERIIADNNLKNVHPEEIVHMKQQLLWESAYLIKPHLQVVEQVYKYHGVLPLAVGTGASRRSAEAQLNQLNLTKYFNVIVTADDVTRHKPEPETFLKCSELLHVQPSECQVFEDGVLGIQAARSAGMYVTDVRPFTVSVPVYADLISK